MFALLQAAANHYIFVSQLEARIHSSQPQEFLTASGNLFLLEHELAIFYFDVFHVIWQLELIALFGQFFL